MAEVSREQMIRDIYYQELGRLEPDQDGLDHWMAQTDLTDDASLREAIRYAAGMTGTSDTGDLLADPAYAAYLRGMQFSESQIQSSLQAAQEAAQRRITQQAGTFDTQRRDSERSVDQSFESRGMFRGGGRLLESAERRAQIDLSQNQFETGVLESSAQAEREAAESIAQLRRDRAEQELAARQRLTETSTGVL